MEQNPSRVLQRRNQKSHWDSTTHGNSQATKPMHVLGS